MSFKNNDLPTLDDHLAWQEEIKRLVRRLSQCPTPHVFGIHGDWGSGKTSFMRQLQFALGGEIINGATVQRNAEAAEWQTELRNEHEKNVVTVWFDAWRFQNEPSLVVALLQEMRKQLPTSKAFKARAGEFLHVTGRALLDSVGAICKIIGAESPLDPEKVQGHADRYAKAHHAEELATNSIHEHLQQTFEALLPNHKKARIIIFIDDLDRCNPKAAMRLLEGLKIYLNIQRCVFVLGMNESVLVDALAEEFSSLKGAPSSELSLRAGHYFEKICSDIYRLPLPTSNAQLLADWIEENLKHTNTLPLTSIAQQKNALLAAIGRDQVLPPNPRRIKALANQWERFANCVKMPEIADGVSEEEKNEQQLKQKLWAVRTLIVTYIHQFNRDVWERWRFNPEFWKEIDEWCNEPSTATSHPGRKEWAGALKSAFQFDDATGGGRGGRGESSGIAEGSSSPHIFRFPNPGDQTVFWLSKLIIEHHAFLDPDDFLLYLNKPSQT